MKLSYYVTGKDLLGVNCIKSYIYILESLVNTFISLNWLRKSLREKLENYIYIK